MKITKRQLRRILKEEMAHARSGLGKSVTDAEFPIVVSYADRSEIAYSQDELDDILNDIGPRGIEYSLDSLEDMEPNARPAGGAIDQFGESMRITKGQLRKIIREAVQMMKPRDPVDTFDKVETLQPGDKITINGKPSVVVSVDDFNANLTYVADGKATLKDLDYRMAVRYDDDPEDMLPEIEIIYMGKGQVPQNLRQPPRKKGPGRSYSVMD